MDKPHGPDVQRSIANVYRDVAIKAQQRAARYSARARRALEEWEREERLAQAVSEVDRG